VADLDVIEVIGAEIRDHADRVEDVGANVDSARGAAGQVSMTAEAYGVLCGPLLVGVLAALESAGIVAIDGCASALDGTATALRAMAKSLEAVDEIASGYVRAAGRQ
jgi:hypothetical protein